MIEIPKRHSLVEEVADSLRRSLHSPEWAKGMPSERILSDLLQVSRPTLRAAIQLLSREGLIRVSPTGRKKHPVPTTRHAIQRGPAVVGLMTCDRFEVLSPSHMYHLYQLRRHLQDAGVRLEVVSDMRLKRESPCKLLEQHLHRIPAACWILHHSTAQVQKWFQARGLPVILMGTCHEGIRFPSLDWDYRAICRHAIGLFLNRGHRRIALVAGTTERAGERLREQGFREAFEAAGVRDGQPVVLHHDDSVDRIHRVVRTALHSSSPPTACLISESVHALNVLTLLTRIGKRVPEDVSLICCDEEWFLPHISPTVACYRADWNLYARRLSRMAVQLANTGVLAARPIRLLPPYHNGESLARCA